MTSLLVWLVLVALSVPLWYYKHIWHVYTLAVGREDLEVHATSSTALAGGLGVPVFLYTYNSVAGASRLLVLTSVLFTLFTNAFHTIKDLRWVSPYKINYWINTNGLTSYSDFEGQVTSTSIRYPGNGINVYVCLKFLIDLTRPYVSGIIVPVFSTTWLGACSVTLYFACGSRGPTHERLITGFIFIWMGTYASISIYICGYWWDFTEGLLDKYRIYFTKQNPTRHWDGSPATMMNYYRSERFRSLSPIRIQAGNTYYLDKFSVPEFWLNVVDKAFFLLSCFPLH